MKEQFLAYIAHTTNSDAIVYNYHTTTGHIAVVNYYNSWTDVNDEINIDVWEFLEFLLKWESL